MTNWKEIHSDFTEELKKSWKEWGFSYHEVKKWIDIGLTPQDFNFAAFLHNNGYESWSLYILYNLEKVKKEYADYIDEWKSIHPNFDYRLQQAWENKGFTYAETKQWISMGFGSSESSQAQEWKKSGFDCEEAKRWTNAGLKSSDAKHISNTSQAQKYLYLNYPRETRNEVKKLKISGWNHDNKRENLGWEKLVGHLDLKEFTNLEELDFSFNKITSLDLTGLKKLKKIEISCNLLTNLNFLNHLNPISLTYLGAADNNLSVQDLSIFSKFPNLEHLWIGNVGKEKMREGIYNRFVGSLESLKNLIKLKSLSIVNTDIEAGLEYLPDSVKKIYCFSQERSESKVKKIAQLLSRDDRFVLNGAKYKRILDEEKVKEKTIDWRDEFKSDLLPTKEQTKRVTAEKSNLSENPSLEKVQIYRNWKDIHPDFAEKKYSWGSETYQQYWEKAGLTYQDAQGWIPIGFKPQHYYEVKELEKAGITYPEAEKWVNLGFKLVNCLLVKQWKSLGITCQEAQGWINSGFKPGDYNLVKEWKLHGFNHEKVKQLITLSFQQKEYKRAKEWEEKKFTLAHIQEWMNAGLRTYDFNYARWLRDVKKVSAEWVLKHDNEQKLRKECSQLETKVIEWIKELTHNYSWNFYDKLTFEQRTLIDKLILNSELKERYKRYGLCQECNQPKTSTNWCQLCNTEHFRQKFNKWTSGNQAIDELIQKTQLEATDASKVLEWIPYDRLDNVKYLAEGGFGKVYKAKWADGLITNWNALGSNWSRRILMYGNTVVLKSLNNSRDTTADFLREIAYHKLFEEESNNTTTGAPVVKCYGVSQNPETKNYLMIMQYIKDGNLREYLRNNCGKLDFKVKLDQLLNIARGLKNIHKKGLIHRDFHAGNILNEDAYCSITDLGLCKPANTINDNEVYGVLPYVAPEVLCGKPYTSSSDIYSFGMLMYEVFSELPPYFNTAHDADLALKICQGLRPNLETIQIPQLAKNLINKCWSSNYEQRPTADELEKSLDSWWNEIYHEKDTEFFKQYEKLEGELNQALPVTQYSYKVHPSAFYTSRLLDFKNLPEPQNSQEINDLFYKLKVNDYPDSKQFDLQIASTEEFNLVRSEHTAQDFSTTGISNELAEVSLEEGQRTKRQLSLESQSKTNQGESKQPRTTGQELRTEPMPIDNNQNPDWTNIHPNFTPELIQTWQAFSFTPEQCQKWININPTQQTQALQEPAFYAWLRDNKELTPEQASNTNLNQLKNKYQQYSTQRQLIAQQIHNF